MKLPVNYYDLHYAERRKVREEYVHRQGGKCYYCGGSLDCAPSSAVIDKKVNRKLFPHGFFDLPIHLHHDHKTGMTIGAVHSRCNAVLWQYHGE